MVFLRFVSTLIALLVICGSANAKDESRSGMAFNQWYCVDSASDLSEFEAGGAGFRVRDVIITERQDSGAPSIHLSATATNRSDGTVVMTMSYVGLTGEDPVFALSTPEFSGTIPDDQSKVIEQSVYAPPGTMASAKRHCLRVDVYR